MLYKEFDVDDGEMICICKVCCVIVVDKFNDLVIVFYDGSFEVLIIMEVIYEDGCKGFISVIL